MSKTLASFEVHDALFKVAGDDYLECLYSGGRWVEGPVYVPHGKYLLFSDIPNDRMLRWDETDGSVSVFRSPAGYTNGHTLDRQGRLVSCEQGRRAVTRTELDGSVTVLADRWDGKRFNSPNDVVVDSTGAVWFTDPPYGITSDYEGIRAEQEIDGCHVYRIDPGTGEVARVADDFQRPNGLAFSPDERTLYIADTAGGHIRSFAVEGAGLRGGEVFAESPGGHFDGLRVDVEGRVWAAAGGVRCFDPDGTLLATLPVPQPAVSNLVFGGPKRNRLFITATDSVYSLMLNTNGAFRL
ncbi:SMP-30/gluconolactonase/LRE family protein [Glycomyces terrestris]|uniref:SMP-30/gluconolactonase/LRE family protein n=1 Tax=Glycomyces terrestris TaxID=2493553 RepID=A0A426UTG4_9ACTN|nr:SMP-30/gluconolactonase/LRE family protein [Glycomyces terrestris]RRR96917.1 SMP-30/gluconolactonase/LRE family protein [Glycomyces terrestris]